MKRFSSFLRRYYGSLIGGAIGLLLVAVYYYYMWQEPTDSILRILQILDHIIPSAEAINNVLAAVMGAATILFFIFGFFSIYLIIFIHTLVTVIIYGLAGLGIHYLLARLGGHCTIIDKSGNI